MRGSFAGVDICRRVRRCEFGCDCVKGVNARARCFEREGMVAYDTNEQVRIVQWKDKDLIGSHDCSGMTKWIGRTFSPSMVLCLVFSTVLIVAVGEW